MGRIRCLRSGSVDSVYTHVDDGLDDKRMEKKGFFASMVLWQKISFISFATLLGILLLIFLIIWVVFPLVFMNTFSLQRYFMFFNFQDPKNPDFNHPENYGIKRVVNFYVTTKNPNSNELVSIGAYLVLPELETNTPVYAHGNETARNFLKNTAYPVVVYLHGVGCNRLKPKEVYEVLRKHFIVVSIDHRGYGDSGPDVPPSEMGIVNDTQQIFKWIRTHTNNDIYVWGHSLGSALSTHTVKQLNEDDNIVPKGLILESPFTTMREEVSATSIGKIFSWLPWFKSTVLDPLERNGFLFKTTTNILSVDCPIMILHAEDDNVIPYTMGRTVSEIAATNRTIPPQGNVTYHQFPRLLGYGHTGITNDPRVPKFIDEFIGFCKDQNKSRG